ncbi:hypothetical protein AVEN_181381-1 [Araneus ventricosus]|uniref:Uncharacterized protein n=1 Tax=Araneus ventricosus TaxID=182803 RepID=A0A4Y2WNB6_ARAVE|nr:hypothetical protein AVEN_181381-1 [Araneus ventricosus]
MEILEQEKKKNIRQGRKPVENSIAALKSRISNQTILRHSGFFGDTLCEAGRHIRRSTRSTLCYKGSKSEIRGVGEGMSDRRSAVKGERRSLSLTARALWNFK